jgi:site-specific DNA-cytosine methylase
MWHMNDTPPQPPAVSHVVHELEHLGYRWAQRVIGLTGFGLPQRRRRVFILASTHGKFKF